MKAVRSLPAEQLFNIAQRQLHPSWPTMVALPAVRGDFHFAQERVHFGNGQDTASADGAVAGHRCGDMVDAFF